MSSATIARDVVNAPFEPVNIDILKIAERVTSTSRETDVEAGPDASGAIGAMRLSAVSRGPNFRWLVFSVHNSSAIPLDYVIVAKRKNFVGSGVFWPEFGARMLVDAQASPGLPPSIEQTKRADAYSFRVESNQTVTYALEVAGPWPDNMSLWQRPAFDQQMQQVSFFHGLLLGIATLVAIYVSSLFIIRRRVMFPAAALFTWCGAAFLAIEFGYLSVLADISAAIEYKIRAIIEALMAFSLLASLYTFVELRKRIPVLGYVTLSAIAACAALAGYAYVEPAVAAGIARVAIVLGAVSGLAIVLTMSRRGVIRAQVALSAWVLIAVWSLLAALAVGGILRQDVIGPGLAAGLVLVNLMVAFTVTQYAFDAGVISSRFFEDSGRRALALAGSEQCVWDWREDQGWLYIGQELERPLGLNPGTLTSGGLKVWLELMHPGDRPAYVAAVETAIQRGRGTFSQEFRLRRQDGTYRWFQLRARTMPGEQGRASRCIGTLADITTLKRSEERMLYDAVQDRLTGLPNRALFMDRLERAMRRSQSNDSVQLFVVVVDIDRFKNVNDGLGHSIGDSLLLTMARRLQSFVGPEDTLARLSGDQFGLVINAAWPERHMHDFTEEIRQSIARPVEISPREVFLTASLGVAEYLRDVLQAADVLKDAEIALYEAKRDGKNKIEFFRPTMRDDRSKLVEIESELRRALERNEIEVAYQPIFNLASENISGFEALVRWRHPKHGVLGPDEFIGIAEETGYIVELGRYVMGEAARQLGIWQRVLRPAEPIFVSVNLSTRQVLDQNLVDDVRTIMTREDVTRGTFKLELTESLVMENVERSAQVLRRLQDIGVAILCDDFGTGYSSLANLQRFSFDTLKIDRSFIDADPDDDAAMVILESIIILAHDLDMRVVAEGVESRDQLERLSDFECDYAQGFYFGEPLTARAVVEALGGSSYVVEQKRGRGSRGFFGKLMRAGVADPDADAAGLAPTAKSQAPGPIVPLAPPPENDRRAPPGRERRSQPQQHRVAELPAPPRPAQRPRPPAPVDYEAPPRIQPAARLEPAAREAARPVAHTDAPPQRARPADTFTTPQSAPPPAAELVADQAAARPVERRRPPEEPVVAAAANGRSGPGAERAEPRPAAAPPMPRPMEPVPEAAPEPQPAAPLPPAAQRSGDDAGQPSAMASARERMVKRPEEPPRPPPAASVNGSSEHAAETVADAAPAAPPPVTATPEPVAAAPQPVAAASDAVQPDNDGNGEAASVAAPESPAGPAAPIAAEPVVMPDDSSAEAPTGANDIAALANALASARAGMSARAEPAVLPPQAAPPPSGTPRAVPPPPPAAPPVANGEGAPTAAKPAPPPRPSSGDEDAELFEREELAAASDHERQLESLSAKRKRPSKLAKLLRRSRKSPTAADQ